MWAELLKARRGVEGTTGDQALVVRGVGGEFCAGADLSGGAPSEGGGRHALASMRHIGDVASALHRIPMPTIAKVRGVAVGAGCNMALGCDLVVASDNARFSEIFSKRGLSID